MSRFLVSTVVTVFAAAALLVACSTGQAIVDTERASDMTVDPLGPPGHVESRPIGAIYPSSNTGSGANPSGGGTNTNLNPIPAPEGTVTITQTPIEMPVPEPEPLVFDEPEPVPVAEVIPERVEITEPVDDIPAEESRLPQTASPLALLALLGAGSAASALGLRISRG